jgi:hypothetical protein
VWDIVESYRFGCDLVGLRVKAKNLVLSDSCIDKNLVIKLCRFSEGEIDFNQVLLAMADAFVFAGEKRIKLISLLVGVGALSGLEGFRKLVGEDHSKLITASPSVQQLLNIIWLYNEDEKDGLVDPTNDNQIRDAFLVLYQNW